MNVRMGTFQTGPRRKPTNESKTHSSFDSVAAAAAAASLPPFLLIFAEIFKEAGIVVLVEVVAALEEEVGGVEVGLKAKTAENLLCVCLCDCVSSDSLLLPSRKKLLLPNWFLYCIPTKICCLNEESWIDYLLNLSIYSSMCLGQGWDATMIQEG